ncbi:hypothetical protein FCV25MIE_08556 [Fagus crenata]
MMLRIFDSRQQDLVGFDHHQIGNLVQIVASKLDQLELRKDCEELILHELEKQLFGRTLRATRKNIETRRKNINIETTIATTTIATSIATNGGEDDATEGGDDDA